MVGWLCVLVSREVYERFGMRERVKIIVDFIGCVLIEEKLEKVVFVGVKGFFICGVFYISFSNLDKYFYRVM